MAASFLPGLTWLEQNVSTIPGSIKAWKIPRALRAQINICNQATQAWARSKIPKMAQSLKNFDLVLTLTKCFFFCFFLPGCQMASCTSEISPSLAWMTCLSPTCRQILEGKKIKLYLLCSNDKCFIFSNVPRCRQGHKNDVIVIFDACFQIDDLTLYPL